MATQTYFGHHQHKLIPGRAFESCAPGNPVFWFSEHRCHVTTQRKREKEKQVTELLQSPCIGTSQPITQTRGWLSHLSPNQWAPHTTRHTYMHLHTLSLSQHDIRDLRYPIWLHIIHALCFDICMHMILLPGRCYPQLLLVSDFKRTWENLKWCSQS